MLWNLDIVLVGSNLIAGSLQLLVPLVSSYRYSGDDVNMALAKSEAKLLHQKISEKAYSCDDIIRILATRSKAQITATLNQYKNEFGSDINKVIENQALCRPLHITGGIHFLQAAYCTLV